MRRNGFRIIASALFTLLQFAATALATATHNVYITPSPGVTFIRYETGLECSGNNVVNEGDTFIVQIYEKPNYSYDELYQDGTALFPQKDFARMSNITEDHEVHVLVTPLWTYPVVASATGTGTVNPSGTTQVGPGESFTVTYTPGFYNFVGSVTSSDSQAVITPAVPAPTGVPVQVTLTTVNAAQSISGVFGRNTHTVTTTALAGGTVNPAGVTTLLEGESLLVFISPLPGCSVFDVKINGNWGAGPLTFFNFNFVTADQTLEAEFRCPNNYVLRDNPTFTEFVEVSKTTNIPTGQVKTYSHDPSLKAVDFMRQGNNGYLLLDGETLTKLVELDANLLPTRKEKSYSHYSYWRASSVWINPDGTGYILWNNNTVLTNGLGSTVLWGIDADLSYSGARYWQWSHNPSWTAVDYSRDVTNKAYLVFYSTAFNTQLWTLSSENVYQSNASWGPSDPLWKPRDYTPNEDGSGFLMWDYEGTARSQGCLWWLNAAKTYTGQYLYYPHASSAKIEAFTH